MIIEERYSLFQIENKLRQLTSEAVKTLSKRIDSEGALLRKI